MTDLEGYRPALDTVLDNAEWLVAHREDLLARMPEVNPTGPPNLLAMKTVQFAMAAAGLRALLEDDARTGWNELEHQRARAH